MMRMQVTVGPCGLLGPPSWCQNPACWNQEMMYLPPVVFQHSIAILKRLININPADKTEMLTVSSSSAQKGTLGCVEDC